MDIVKHNSIAWDNKVKNEVVYTKAVSKEIIERSKSGANNIQT